MARFDRQTSPSAHFTIKIPVAVFLSLALLAYAIMPLVIIALLLIKGDVFIAFLVGAMQLFQLPIVVVVYQMLGGGG